MIYGLLWAAFVVFLLLIRPLRPRVQATCGAMAGVALSVAAWTCHLYGFEPGPTPPWLRSTALGLFALLTLFSLLTLVRTSMKSDESLKEWPATMSISTLLVLTFVFVIGGLDGPPGVAIGGALFLFLLSMFLGRSGPDRRVQLTREIGALLPRLFDIAPLGAAEYKELPRFEYRAPDVRLILFTLLVQIAMLGGAAAVLSIAAVRRLGCRPGVGCPLQGAREVANRPACVPCVAVRPPY